MTGFRVATIDIASIRQRLRSARLFRPVSVYAIAAYAVLQGIDLLTAQFGLPGWFFRAGLALVLAGLPVVCVTAVIQGRVRERIAPPDRSPGKADSEPERGAHRVFTWRLATLAGLLALLGLGSLGVAMVWLRNRGHRLQLEVVTVMPFHVVGEGVQLWREGLVDLMSTALDATGQFRASDPRAVINRWRRVAQDPDVLPEPEIAADVAASLNAGRLILGSLIRTSPGQVRVSADLYSVRWLRRVASGAVEGSEEEMTTLVDRLTIELLRSIWEGDSVPSIRLSALTTTSLPALRAYLEGEQALRRSQFEEAQMAFSAAIDADSTLAIAHYRLGLSYGWGRGIGSDARRHFAAAARHTQGLTERDSLVIVGWKLVDVDGDLNGIGVFERLAARYPDDVEAWYGLGEAYFHLGGQMGLRIEDSIDPFERTLTLDPTFAPALIHMIEHAYTEMDSVRGRALTERYLSLDSTSYYARSFELLTSLAFGSSGDSAAAAQALDTLDAESLRWAAARLRQWGPANNLPHYERVNLALTDPRHPDDERGRALWTLGLANLRLGRIAESVDLFELALPLFAGDMDDAVLYVLVNAREFGLTDPSVDEMIERLSRRSDDLVSFAALAVEAAREGRFDDARAGVERLQEIADSVMAAGDSVAARSVQGRAWTLRGRLAAVTDSVDAAIAHLRRGLAMINGLWTAPRDIDRYWLAGLIRDRGGEDEALRIYGSLYWNPWLEALGYYERARLHERRGEREQALLYYSRFLEMWADADPHLQPRIESAQRAMERLAGEPTTSHPR